MGYPLFGGSALFVVRISSEARTATATGTGAPASSASQGEIGY
jgi:hypothetical protein